jgi:hypothetical protein
MGLIEIEETDDWKLENQGPFDILIQNDAENRPIRKIYLDNCTDEAAMIEYLDYNQKVVADLQLNNYKTVTDDFSIPTEIIISNVNADNTKNIFKISLNSPKPKEFSEKLIKALFVRPESDGFKHVIEVTKEGLIETKQE